jgi:serine/threonine protein kinase
MSPEEQESIKDMICYVPPEHAANILLGANHLSDLYGLGATFWRLLAGRRMFAGNLRMILGAVINREPPTLQSIRPDIPTVISKIIRKLLSKNPDDRYASASGLKEDLIECTRNLGQGWASEMGTVELIKDFPLGRSDHYSVFHIYGELFGREQEAKLIQRNIRDFAARYTRRQHTFGSQSYGSGSGSIMSTDTVRYGYEQKVTD